MILLWGHAKGMLVTNKTEKHFAFLDERDQFTYFILQ